MNLDDVKKETLIQSIRDMNRELSDLKKENSSLRKQLREMEQFREDTFLLMSENFRYKRMMELLDEEKTVIAEELEKTRKRLLKAERSIRNLQKWMELKGITGGWYSE